MAQSASALAAFVEKPKETSFETQTHDEELLLLLRRHWVTNVPWVAMAIVMLFIPPLIFQFILQGYLPELSGIPPKFQLVATLLWYLFTLGLVFESFIIWYFNVLIITRRRIVDVDFWGLLHKSVSETTIDNIQDVTHEIGGFWRVVFNFGNVYIQTAAEVPRIEFLDVPKPDLVHKKITELVQKYG